MWPFGLANQKGWMMADDRAPREGAGADSASMRMSGGGPEPAGRADGPVPTGTGGGPVPAGRAVPTAPGGPAVVARPAVPAGGMVMAGASMAGAGMMMGAGAPMQLDGRPYIGRSVRLLGRHKGVTALSVALSFVITLLPFVAGAAFGPLLQTLGVAAAEGRLDRVWGMTASLSAKSGGDQGGPFGFLAAPIPFAALFAIWAIATVSILLLQFVKAWSDARLEQRLQNDLRRQLHDHLQSLSLDFFSGGRTGALMQRVTSEVSAVSRLLTSVLLTPIIDVVVLLIALAYLASLSWQMTLVAFVLAPAILLITRFSSKRLQQAAMRMTLSSRGLASHLEETLSGIADIQVFNAQRRRNAGFNAESERMAEENVKGFFWVGFTNNSAQVLIALNTALVLLVGILFGPTFGLTLAGIIVFFQFVMNVFAPLQRLIGTYTTYQSLVPNIVATYQLLDTQPTVREQSDARDMGEVHGHIEFEDVVFGYSPTQKVLDGVSFSIREGETIALVGAIGSGKSTIFNLLLRFLEPESGRIVIDGQEIRDVTLHSLRTQVSKLSQFPFFLKDTIRENVRMGKEDADEQEIVRACQAAHIDHVITDPRRMPMGYDTVVDVQVPSGGQKRLIALARCLIRRPEILLFDEPTENLDAEERNLLRDVIRDYANERTCMVISHDMDFIAGVADRILVLEGGKLADQGSHEELLARGGLYKKLYEVQNVDPALLRPAASDPTATAVAAGLSMGGMSMGGMSMQGMRPA
jgi:ABC-type multidrug transport system fused ATPase/permease subunit